MGNNTSLKRFLKGFSVLVFVLTTLLGVRILLNPTLISVRAEMNSTAVSSHSDTYGVIHESGIVLTQDIADNSSFYNGGDYYLESDIVLTKDLVFNGTVTINLCLNGYTIDGGDSFGIRVYKTFNLYDCSENASGMITSSVNNTITVDDAGTFNIYGGTIKNTSENQNRAVYNSGEVLLDGGTIINENGYGVYQQWNTPNFVMNSGSINARIGIENSSSQSKITVNGGNLESSGNPISVSNASSDGSITVKITNGTFSYSNYLIVNGIWEISGGSYTNNNTDPYSFDIDIRNTGIVKLIGALNFKRIRINSFSSNLSETETPIDATNYTGSKIEINYYGGNDFASALNNYVIKGVSSADSFETVDSSKYSLNMMQMLLH